MNGGVNFIGNGERVNSPVVIDKIGVLLAEAFRKGANQPVLVDFTGTKPFVMLGGKGIFGHAAVIYGKTGFVHRVELEHIVGAGNNGVYCSVLVLHEKELDERL